MEYDWKEEKSSWCAAEKNLDTEMRRKLFAVVVSEEVRHVMIKHLFRYRDKQFNQCEGGSIGSVLTGVLGTSRMIIFLRKLSLRCEVLGLQLYFVKAFVDDASVGMRDPGKGCVVKDDH